MTVYHASDKWANANYTAGNKARNDIESILNSLGIAGLVLDGEFDGSDQGGALQKISKHFRNYTEWKKQIKRLNKGDVLLFQFPPAYRTALFFRVVNFARHRGVEVVLLIHDVELFRAYKRDDLSYMTKLGFRLEQGKSLALASINIAHNEVMSNILVDEFNCRLSAIVNLGLFDYLSPGAAAGGVCKKDGPIVIAGNLRPHKAGYLYSLPLDCQFALYGVGLDESKLFGSNVNYKGKFSPDDGPNTISGSWGLVWDGDSADTCSGAYGEYLRINNPHKASLYLAAGLPVIVWSQAAIAPFVLSHNVGIAVDSLYEIAERLEVMSDDEYQSLRGNAIKLAGQLRAGHFTKGALAEVGRSIDCPELMNISKGVEKVG